MAPSSRKKKIIYINPQDTKKIHKLSALSSSLLLNKVVKVMVHNF